MNVTNRDQFELFLKDLRENEIKVFDTETNGLRPYNGNQIISLSVYFPDVDRSYNLPFRHGHGEVKVRYNETHPVGMLFEQMSWQGNTKKDKYLQHWFTTFKANVEPSYFENLPIEWLDEIKAAWGAGTYIGHNVRFDAHFLYTEGFPDMERFVDTMVMLHIVCEDWQGIELDAPYTYTAKDATEGRCSKEEVGGWAREIDGTLKTKKQSGKRALKWQAARIGLPGATEGETGLRASRHQFEIDLTDFIVEHWDDPSNASLLTKMMVRALKGETDYNDQIEKARAKIRSKIDIDEKAHMWMLPSGLVSQYAELDVKLTWGLFIWCLPIIKEWDNIDLFQNVSAIHQHVAWEMERRGFKLDRKTAEEEIAKLEPRIADIEALFDINISSPDQLLEYLNSGVLGEPWNTFPAWWPEQKRLNLKVYPNVRLNEYDLDEQYDPLEATNKSEFDKVSEHGIIRLIREHRMMSKSINTYLKKWLKAADNNDVVHGSYNTDGTVAGRMSSSGDAGNKQNIPDRNGYTIKRAFITEPERVFVAFDYSTLELRLAAWIAEVLLKFDPNYTMSTLLRNGADMHVYTRDMLDVRGVLYGDMTDEEIMLKLGYDLKNPKYATPEARAKVVNKDRCRFVAKTANFGLLYSGGVPMLMKLLKLDDTKAAKTLVDGWRRLYPAFPRANRYFTELAQTYRLNPGGKQRLFVQQPISGRYRKFDLYPKWKNYFKDGQWQGFNSQEAAQRKVWNNTVQGLGGYICTASAYNILDEFGKDRVYLHSQIHDALEMSIRRDDLAIVPEIIKIMEDWPDVDPGLKAVASGSTSNNWQDMVEIGDMGLWIASQGTKGFKED